MAILRLLVAVLVGVVACASESAAPPVALKAVSDADNAILAVVPASDLRINARMPPAIELTAGGVLRLAEDVFLETRAILWSRLGKCVR
jgi:hypothetical protein